MHDGDRRREEAAQRFGSTAMRELRRSAAKTEGRPSFLEPRRSSWRQRRATATAETAARRNRRWPAAAADLELVAAALGGTGGLGRGGKRKRRTRGRFIWAWSEEIKPQTGGIESGRNRTRFLGIKTKWVRFGSNPQRFSLILEGKERGEREEQKPLKNPEKNGSDWGGIGGGRGAGGVGWADWAGSAAREREDVGLKSAQRPRRGFKKLFPIKIIREMMFHLLKILSLLKQFP